MPLLSHVLKSANLPDISKPGPEIRGVTEDSRDVKPGWIFVAIKGTQSDGGTFIPNALERGAAAIVTEELTEAPVPVIRVASAREALADCAAALNNFPSHRLKVLGVTGTDGKTTTCYFLASILRTAGLRTGMITTVETRVGDVTKRSPNRMTTPSAPYVQRTLADMVSANDEAAIVEASSHALAQDRLRNVQLQGAVITNIATDHIEFHGSQDSYAKAKWKIFDLVGEAEGPRIAINRDDEWSMRLAQSDTRPSITFGSSEPADLRLDEESGSPHLGFIWQGDRVDVDLPMGGRFNAYNALAAAAVALTQGLSLREVKRGLETARTPPGRLQKVDMGQDFSLYVDYAHTEQAFEAVLRYLRCVSEKRSSRLICVFGAAGGRDRSKRSNLARLASKYCDYFVITNEDPCNEDPSAIMAEIASGADVDHRGSSWDLVEDRRAAISHAIDHARHGDIVVLTGKGHEESIAMSDGAIAWSDEVVARHLLQGAATKESRFEDK